MLTNAPLFGILSKLSAATTVAARLHRPRHNTERFGLKNFEKVLDKQSELCYFNKVAVRQLQKLFEKT